MRPRAVVAAVVSKVAFLAVVGSASANLTHSPATASMPLAEQARVIRINLAHDRGVIRFFQNHPLHRQVAASRPLLGSAAYGLWWARRHEVWASRSLHRVLLLLSGRRERMAQLRTAREEHPSAASSGFSVPADFYRAAMCVHHYEMFGHEWDWHYRGYFRGGMQFLGSTWSRAGGIGDPADASEDEQVYRAWRIVSADGSWREWPNTARMCGLPVS